MRQALALLMGLGGMVAFVTAGVLSLCGMIADPTLFVASGSSLVGYAVGLALGAEPRHHARRRGSRRRPTGPLITQSAGCG